MTFKLSKYDFFHTHYFKLKTFFFLLIHTIACACISIRVKCIFYKEQKETTKKKEIVRHFKIRIGFLKTENVFSDFHIRIAQEQNAAGEKTHMEEMREKKSCENREKVSYRFLAFKIFVLANVTINRSGTWNIFYLSPEQIIMFLKMCRQHFNITNGNYLVCKPFPTSLKYSR